MTRARAGRGGEGAGAYLPCTGGEDHVVEEWGGGCNVACDRGAPGAKDADEGAGGVGRVCVGEF